MRTIVIVLLFFSISAAYAQTQLVKGSKLLGGSLNFNSVSETNDAGVPFRFSPQATRSFGINPRYGWFVRDNVAFGISLGFNTLSQRINFSTNDFDHLRSTGFSVGVFTRRYVALSPRFALFGEGSFSAGLSAGNREVRRSGTGNIDSDVRGFSASLGISPGVTFFATKRLAVESSVGLASVLYLRNSETTASGSSIANNFGISANPFSSLNVGFIWYFAKPTE
ncbi:MAG: outer membrane beta-barrel protein [Cytophagales bacterium]|jgi:hypothetical protein|nr:outer membrane beta-barrel protein [Cytophagales bacterium]